MHNGRKSSASHVPARQSSIVSAAACIIVGGLALSACQIPDFNQFNSPKFDVSSIVPPDPNEFARSQRSLNPVGPADLVDASGVCPGAAAPPQPQSDSTGDTQVSTAPPVVTAPRGVALEMTECEVVRAAGVPAEVQINADPQGQRTTTLVYATPERPIYRFVGGRLKVIERGAEPPPPEPVGRKPARKPAKRQSS